MARYFFQVTGTLPINDDKGEEFSTPEEAFAAAEEAARALAMNQEPAALRGQFLRVTDEAGAEVASLQLDGYRNALSS